MQRAAIISFLILLNISSLAQNHGRGALLDTAVFKNCPRAPVLMKRDIINLPSKISLQRYAPTPGDQGSLSTCSGWAVAYSARTMVAAIQNNWDHEEINKNVFSPSFIYNQIRTKPGCKGGTSVVQGLDILKTEGVLKMEQFSYNCNLKVKADLKKLALKYKIKEYRTIAYGKTKNKVILVKKSLSEKNPVIIAINCPDSFQSAGEVWNPDSSDYYGNFGGHALVVIGYDDVKYGGAFQVINSWGVDWGNNGFTWIRYNDFIHFCVWAGEEIPDPSEKVKQHLLSGSLLFSLSSGNNLALSYDGNIFHTRKAYPSGTRFNLIFSNHEPAYVYAVGSDQSYKCKVLFPFNSKINPYLPYKENDIALPGNGYNFQLDNNPGKTYFCFLYSPLKLNIESIAANLENSKGDFYERIHNVLSGKLIAGKDININLHKNGAISFKTDYHKNRIMYLLVEINHSENK